jgi:hypothetical protein
MSQLIKVRIELHPENLLNSSAETLWAEPLGGGLFKLQNSPFGAYGFSYEDIVICDNSNIPNVLGVHQNSGRSTYRILLKPNVIDSTAFKNIWEEFDHIGCTYEGSESKLLAVDVPAETNIFEVYKLLEIGEDIELWEFEEAKCAHAIDV